MCRSARTQCTSTHGATDSACHHFRCVVQLGQPASPDEHAGANDSDVEGGRVLHEVPMSEHAVVVCSDDDDEDDDADIGNEVSIFRNLFCPTPNSPLILASIERAYATSY